MTGSNQPTINLRRSVTVRQPHGNLKKPLSPAGTGHCMMKIGPGLFTSLDTVGFIFSSAMFNLLFNLSVGVLC